MKSKKILAFVGILVLAGFLFYKAIWAATSDTFTITITVAYISIELKDYAGNDYDTWAIGTVGGGAISTMDANNGGPGEQGIKVSNESNVAIDLSSYATNTLSWTLESSPGENQYVLRAKGFDTWQASSEPTMSSAVTILSNSDPGTNVETNVSASTHRYWYYDLTAPTSVTSPSQNTITVTIKASAH
ncbi:MAG: hypothetical protein ACPL4K_03385 [Candidatus Margulisiibacteriota bacterium]